MDISVSGTIDQKTYLKNLGEGFSPLSLPLDPPMTTYYRKLEQKPGKKSVVYLGPKIWHEVPPNIKSKSLLLFFKQVRQ